MSKILVKMSPILFLFIFANLASNLAAEYVEYEPPSTAQFPFGDEILNSDLREERVLERARDIAIEIIGDIYTSCPNITEIEVDHFGDAPDSHYLCAKCDVRPTSNNTQAFVECYNCTGLPIAVGSQQQEGDISVDHILYAVTFIEISNYTAPDDSSYY